MPYQQNPYQFRLNSIYEIAENKFEKGIILCPLHYQLENGLE